MKIFRFLTHIIIVRDENSNIRVKSFDGDVNIDFISYNWEWFD